MIKVGSTEIEFKKKDKPAIPTYTVLISETRLVTYQNGTTDLLVKPQDIALVQNQAKQPTDKLKKTSNSNTKDVNLENDNNLNQAKNKGYIGFLFGLARPIGKFASKKFGAPSGFANQGYLLNISLGYKIGKHLGIAANIHSQSNPFDVATSRMQFQYFYPSYKINEYSATSWTRSGLMVGGFVSTPVNRTLTFDSRVMVGIVNAKSASQSIIYVNGSNLESSTIESKNNLSLSVMAGIGLRYTISEGLSLLANYDYAYAKPTFTKVAIREGNTVIDNATFEQKMASLNFSIGLGVRL